MQMKAVLPFYKDGRVILEGESFATSDQHARELVARGIAKTIEPAAAKPKAEQKRTKKA